MTLPPAERAEILALLRLRECPGLGDRGIGMLVDRYGSASAAVRREGRQGALWPERELDRKLDGWGREGIGVLALTSPRYPDCLKHLSDPPALVFTKGDPGLLSRPAVAIVGSRKATEAGRRTAERLAGTLAQAGVIVVSGLALGIDGAAHRGALRRGTGRTVAVLGSGIRVPYPAAHRSLFRRIAEEGLLVSEFLPDTKARPHHFPRRNRIIAALVRAVIVVEAGRRSGALITVDHALDLGKEILAVPGSLENPQAEGSNALLRDGARVIADRDAIVQQLEDVLPPGHCRREPTGGEATHLPPELRPIWSVLSSDPLSVDQLAEMASVTPAEALAGLSALELGGWVVQRPGLRFQRS